MDGVVPPLYVITADDKRGLVVVITATVLSFVWTCQLIRIWLRWKTWEWRSDDYFLAAATILDTIQSALVLHVVDEGFGSSGVSLSEVDLRRIGKIEFASQVLYVITLFLSKCAVLSLYLRLSPSRDHAIASWATAALSAAWAMVSIVLIALPCTPTEFWADGPAKCTGVYTRWRAITALDITTESLIFLISIYLVSRLHMRTSSKLMVVGAFSARLPVIAASASRLHYFSLLTTSPDRTLDAAYYNVCTQWEMGYAIMSSTITGLGPFLRPFSKSFSTSYRRSSYAANSGAQSSTLGNDGTSASRSRSGAGNYQIQMNALQPRKLPSVNTLARQNDVFATGNNMLATYDHPLPSPLHLRPDMEEFARNTAVTGGSETPAGDDEDAVSMASDESRRMIITKKTELTVETDRASAVSDGSGWVKN